MSMRGIDKQIVAYVRGCRSHWCGCDVGIFRFPLLSFHAEVASVALNFSSLCAFLGFLSVFLGTVFRFPFCLAASTSPIFLPIYLELLSLSSSPSRPFASSCSSAFCHHTRRATKFDLSTPLLSSPPPCDRTYLHNVIYVMWPWLLSRQWRL